MKEELNKALKTWQNVLQDSAFLKLSKGMIDLVSTTVILLLELRRLLDASKD